MTGNADTRPRCPVEGDDTDTTPARGLAPAAPKPLPAVLPVTMLPAASDSIAAYSAASSDGLETGGLLLGHLHDDGVVVRYAGGPGPAAQREPTRFRRDLAFARGLADAAWKLDRSIWIGEWHTHPNASPVPSDIDMETYARHLNDPDLTLPTFLSLIVTAAPDWRQPVVTAWTVISAGHVAAAVATTLVTEVPDVPDVPDVTRNAPAAGAAVVKEKP